MSDIDKYLALHKAQRTKGQTRHTYRNKNAARKVSCEVCTINPNDKSTLDFHRIIPSGKYEDSNVIIVCQSCHRLIHNIIKYMETKEYRLAIVIAKLEFRNLGDI